MQSLILSQEAPPPFQCHRVQHHMPEPRWALDWLNKFGFDFIILGVLERGFHVDQAGLKLTT